MTWKSGTVEDWANESLEIARTAYKIPGSNQLIRQGARLGRDYELVNLPLATKRVAQSGVRLAEVLNSIFE